MKVEVPVELLFHFAIFLLLAVGVFRLFFRLLLFRFSFPVLPAVGPGEPNPKRSGNSLAFWIPLIILGGILYAAHSNDEEAPVKKEPVEEEPYVPPKQKEPERGSPDKDDADLYQDESKHVRKVSSVDFSDRRTPDTDNEVLPVVKDVPEVPKYWHVQVASTSSEANARTYVKKLIGKGLNEVGVVFAENAYKVVVGRFATELEGKSHSKHIRVKYGIDAFPKRIQP